MGLSRRSGVVSWPAGGGSSQVFGQAAWERIECVLPDAATYTPSAVVWNANAIVFTGGGAQATITIDPANMPENGMWFIQNDTNTPAVITITGIASGTRVIRGNVTYMIWLDESGWNVVEAEEQWSVPTINAVTGGSGGGTNTKRNPNAQHFVWLIDNSSGACTITPTTPVIGDLFTLVQVAGSNNCVFNANVVVAGVPGTYTFNTVDRAVTFMYVGDRGQTPGVEYWRVVSSNGGGSSTAPTLVTASAASQNISQASRTIVRRTYATAACTLVLPTTPVLGDEISVKDASGVGGTYATVIDGNGKNVDGASTWNSLTSVTPALGTKHGFVLVYDGTEWEVF